MICKLAKDSKICDEKSLLCEHSQGRALGVRNRRECEAIKDLSRKTSEAVQGEAAAGFFSKAESTSQKS